MSIFSLFKRKSPRTMEEAVHLLIAEIDRDSENLNEFVKEIRKTLPENPSYPRIFKLSFDQDLKLHRPEIVRLADFIRKEFLWGDGEHPEKEFILVHAQFARRRSDGMEVEFISRHELRYKGEAGNFVLFCEAIVDDRGIPGGSAVEAPKGLTDKQKSQLAGDLNEAAVILKTSISLD